jgi:hypothetical protein
MKRKQADIPHGMRKIVGRSKRWRNKHPGVHLRIPRTELQPHARAPAAHPAEWMPWNYRRTLQRAGV